MPGSCVWVSPGVICLLHLYISCAHLLVYNYTTVQVDLCDLANIIIISSKVLKKGFNVGILHPISVKLFLAAGEKQKHAFIQPFIFTIIGRPALMESWCSMTAALRARCSLLQKNSCQWSMELMQDGGRLFIKKAAADLTLSLHTMPEEMTSLSWN